jgi:hypothetical protein
MQEALDAFEKSLERIEHFAGLYQAIVRLTTPAVDSSDLLRAQIVLIVSALDFYVHELTVLGMLAVYMGQRPSTQAFERYRISVGSMMVGQPLGGTAWLETEIRERHGYLSFQQPEKIADAVRLFSDVKLWPAVATLLGQDESNIRSSLRLIVDRRNKIAHEADIDPSYPGARWPISEADAAQCRQFIATLVKAIHATVA